MASIESRTFGRSSMKKTMATVTGTNTNMPTARSSTARKAKTGGTEASTGFGAGLVGSGVGVESIVVMSGTSFESWA
ncbi:hypothetical protein ACFYT5_39575 [Streptomyces anulatus]|uniref:hypothetical protein n=1 Tax=Streptomyces anulatus TaxID=1892 RepID=UPI003691C574